jgi:hypothetical protein
LRFVAALVDQLSAGSGFPPLLNGYGELIGIDQVKSGDSSIRPW